jgi:Rad3-related DNA helicase
MSASATDDDLDHLVQAMDAVIQARHLGQKGIIHTVSYKLRDQIMERSKWRQLMVTHASADRIAQLEYFRTLPEGYILVSPSMTTGVDLPADQCRWQMLPKMPFPYLGDEMIRMRKDDDRRLMWKGRDVRVGDLFYAWATATAITQAYGRAMRSAEDWGFTYLFDSNFGSFHAEGRWGPLFPNWFREAVKYSDLEELV